MNDYKLNAIISQSVKEVSPSIYDVLGKLMDKFVIEWYKSQIPYKPEAPAVEKKPEAPKEEPKQEGVAPDETTLKHKGLKLAKIDNQNIGE